LTAIGVAKIDSLLTKYGGKNGELILGRYAWAKGRDNRDQGVRRY
jgi:hypothetical protein